MNVLSLCDGMSCGQIALKELGIQPDRYYASEVDKAAITVTQRNFPDTIQLGDIRTVSSDLIRTLPKIDLILCGFPCRDLSITTRNGGSNNWDKMHSKGIGLSGEHSGLYFEFIRILNSVRKENEDVKFLVENVASMKENERQTISEDLQTDSVLIDSGDYSAQERKRYYWANFPIEPKPLSPCKDVIKDILQECVDDKYFYALPIEGLDLSKRVVGKIVFPFKAHDIIRRIYNIENKSPTLTSCRGGNIQKKIYTNGRVRKLTPIEYRRLQTIPEWYITDVSDSSIYNLCGDGWTIEVIKHILSNCI